MRLDYGALETGAVGGIVAVGLLATDQAAEVSVAYAAGRKADAGAVQERIAPVHQKIVAERVIRDEDITVAVNVRGRLAEPFITISSTPAMPSNQALSYLLTGRSIDTLQSNEATSVDRAAETLAISGGGLLLGTVESRGTDDTEVVLGKYISPKLFVSYGISIVEAINTIKLRYTINSHWSLKAEAGLEQSADVEYRIER